MFLDDAIRYALRQSGLTTEDISKAVIRAEIVPALVDRLSRLAPTHEIVALDLVADQTFYDPPVSRIQAVLEGPIDVGVSGDISGAPAGIIEPGSLRSTGRYGFDLYGSPMIEAIAVEMNAICTATSITLVGDKIRVMPTPTSADTIYLLVARGWDFQTTEEVGIGDGATLAFDLSARVVWGGVALEDGAPVEEDIVTFADGNPATLTYDAGFAPASAVAVSAAYYQTSNFEDVPAHLREGFRLMLTAMVARAEGQVRARFPEVEHSESKMRIGSRQLLRLADTYEEMAVGALDLEDADQGVVVQG